MVKYNNNEKIKIVFIAYLVVFSDIFAELEYP